MATKTSIIDVLGEQALLLPQKLAEGLIANDRVKFYFSLLQAAERHADHPEESPTDLSAEQHAASIEGEPVLAIGNARREEDGSLHVPGAAALIERIVDGLAAMCAPLALAQPSGAAELLARERALTEALPRCAGDRVPKNLVSAMTRARGRSEGAAGEGSADTLHLLVMDLHRALNGLQSGLAEETIEGAHVWRIDAADRGLIRAFMSGVNETAPLKFTHPGLGTTATRIGARLVIQNDIGTTDAHVLVLHVEAHTAILTYTDVHRQRVAFFESLFKPFAVQWSDSGAHHDERLLEEKDYLVSVGRFEAADTASLERYLAFLGSRIVFLIDWNRGRKQLREFVPNAAAVRLLRWAADNGVGHRGFLELGGARLLTEAIEFAQRTPLRYGERLHEALGDDATFEFLQFVLREATTGLLQRRSERFIRDEIKAELARRFRTAHAGLLSIALAHAERVYDLAADLRDALWGYADPYARERLDTLARRARKWEQECDASVSRVRALAERTSKPAVYRDLMHQADEAADGLEEAAFLATHLVALSPKPNLMEPVRELAALLVTGAQESVKMYESARHVTREGAREDTQDFFAAVDSVVAMEHDTDEAERTVTTALFANEVDARTLNLLARLTRALEEAADALAHSALMLRDYLLGEIMMA